MRLPVCSQEAVEAQVALKFDGYVLNIWGNGGYDTPEVAAKAAAAPPGTPTPMPNWRAGRVGRIAMLRRVCQLTGVQVAARSYNFAMDAPVTAEVSGLRMV